MSPKYSIVQKQILLSCLIYSQIWLRPLVNGYQSTNFTKLKKLKKKKKKKKPQSNTKKKREKKNFFFLKKKKKNKKKKK